MKAGVQFWDSSVRSREHMACVEVLTVYRFFFRCLHFFKIPSNIHDSRATAQVARSQNSVFRREMPVARVEDVVVWQKAP